MSKRLDDLKQIEAYLAGELTPEDRVRFEEKMLSEQAVQENTEITRRLIKAIRGYGFKQMIKGIHDDHFGKDPIEE